MIDFIKAGKIGGIAPGMTQEQVRLALGPPKHWRGDGEDIFAGRCPDPADSVLWFFWGHTVVVHFDFSGLVSRITVYLEDLDPGTFPFEDWPYMGITLASLEAWLLKRGISYLWLEDEGWIATSTGAYALLGGPAEFHGLIIAHRNVHWMSPSTLHRLRRYAPNVLAEFIAAAPPCAGLTPCDPAASNREKLILVIKDAERLISRPTNRFYCRELSDLPTALETLATYRADIERGDFSQSLYVRAFFGDLIAVVAEESGWAVECMELQLRFREAYHP